MLHRLIREERFRPEEIAILVAARKWINRLAPGGRIGAFEVTDECSGVKGRVLLETIHRFKGLERPVIILAGLREEPSYVDLKKLLYVGASRAQLLLVIVGPLAVLARFGGGSNLPQD